MRGNMVINRSDAKKRKKDGEMLHNSLPESPKRTKVHAQRKFAQGSSLNSPTMTPVKDKDKSKSNGSVSSSELIPSKRPKTEDFLTFLCLRGTPILPPRLDFFNLATVPDGQEDEVMQPVPENNKESIRSKTVPMHSHGKPSNNAAPTPKSSPKLTAKVTEKKTDACDLSTSGVSRKNERYESKESISKNGSNRRSTTAVQALKRKYQEQRLAKQRGNVISKLVQIVKEKSMIRTRSSTVLESIHLTTRNQPVVKLEKLSKSKIFKKTSEKATTPPKKEQTPKVSRNSSSHKRVTRSIVLSKESNPKSARNASASSSKGSSKIDQKQNKRGSLRSRANSFVAEEEHVVKTRSLSRQRPCEKQSNKPSKESKKSPVKNTPERKTPPSSKYHSKSPQKAQGKVFASSLSDFSSDDDQPLVKKTTKMSIQNVRRTKLVKKALKRIAMKNRKPTRMVTRSQQHHPTLATKRISHRPTRKTKEAATVFMELIGKKWTSLEDDNADDELVSLVNFPDIRKFNKQGKNEGDFRSKKATGSMKKDLKVTPSKDRSKSTFKLNLAAKKVADVKEKTREELKDDKAKISKERVERNKPSTSKEKKSDITSHKERLLREKMHKNTAKVLCKKTAHSKCFAGGNAGRKIPALRTKPLVHQVQTRTRSLRSDSSDEVSKKQMITEKSVQSSSPENMQRMNRTTRRSVREIEETKTSQSLLDIVVENKEDIKSRTSDLGNSPRPSRPLRKSVTRNDAIHQRRTSSQSDEKFSDSDEEPLGRKVIKNLKQSAATIKGVQERKELGEKPKESDKKVDDKAKNVGKKIDDKSKEPIKKEMKSSNDVVRKGSEKAKEMKKGDEKIKDAIRKGDGKNVDAVKVGDEKALETEKRNDNNIRESVKKSSDRSKVPFNKVGEKKCGAVKKDEDRSCELSMKKRDEKPRRASLNVRKTEEVADSEIHEISTRARSLKITGSDSETGKVTKRIENDKPAKSESPKSHELSKEFGTPCSPKGLDSLSPAQVNDDAPKKTTRNDKPLKVSEQLNKIDDKLPKKKVMDESSCVISPKNVGIVKSKSKGPAGVVPKDDLSNSSSKQEGKRPLESAAADNDPCELKKLKGSSVVNECKIVANELSQLPEPVPSQNKSITKVVIVEKLTTVGSKVDEALQSMKKDTICPLISNTETPIELAKIESGSKKKPTSAFSQGKKEPAKQLPSKKGTGVPEVVAKCREPVEIRCDKMCERSKLFSIEKQAHGGLVLVKKVPVSESVTRDFPLDKAQVLRNDLPEKTGNTVKKCDAVASGSFASIKGPNPGSISVSGRCTCKSWVNILGKPTLGNATSCPIHGDGMRASVGETSHEHKTKESDSPSKDSRKSSDDVTNAESVHNTSVFGTDVDSFNDIECADNEERRKVSKTVEDIEKWLLVSDIINSGKAPEDKDKPGENELQANKIEFDNLCASVLSDRSASHSDSVADNVNSKKTALNSQVSMTLESVEKGIGIPLQTFYNRGMHRGLPKLPDPLSFRSLKVKDERMSSSVHLLQSSSKLKQSAVSQADEVLKVERVLKVEKVSEICKQEVSEGPSKIQDIGGNLDPQTSCKPKVLIPRICDDSDPCPPLIKIETKRSPTKSKTGGTIGGLKKSSSLRNFRMKHDLKVKPSQEEILIVPQTVTKTPSISSISPVKSIIQHMKSSPNKPAQTSLLNVSCSSDDIALSVIKSEASKNQRPASERVVLTSTPEKKPIFLKGGNNFTVRKPKEGTIRRTPSIGAFSPENESSVYAFETEDREATPVSTPFRRKTKDGGTNTSPDKLHHRHSSSSSESSSFICSEVGSPSTKSVSSDVIHISKPTTPENSNSGGIELDVVKTTACTTSIAVQVNLDESLKRNAISPPISVPIYIPSSSKEVGLSTSSSSPLVLISETRSTECSTQTDSSDGNEKSSVNAIETSVSQKQTHSTSEGHLFYIPLRQTSLVNQTSLLGSQTTTISSNQLIRGVAVKLGTEGPTGPNQRVIMHAELVTEPPQLLNPSLQCQTGTLTSGSTTFKSELPEVKCATFITGTSRPPVQHLHPSVVNLPSDPKHLCHPSLLPISVVSPATQPILAQQQSPLPRPSVPPPVGTVQPTARPRLITSVDGVASKATTLCVTSTQTDSEKSTPAWSGPSAITPQPKLLKVVPKTKDNVDHISPGPSGSKASTSTTKRSQSKSKRASAGSLKESDGSSSSTSSVPLTNHRNPMASFPATGSPARMVEAPTFHPTEKEFQDPLDFIERIRPIAEKFGVCRVVPPPNFKPDCQVSDDMRFTAYNQYVHKMLHRWGPNVKEMMVIKKYLRTQSISLTHPPWIGGMEVDLPRLYQTVQSFGGLKEVIEKKRWQRVADGMRIPKSAQDRVTKLDDIYCKYLLPYDTLSPDERQKLFDDIEKEWGDRENQPLNLEGQGNDDDSEGDTSDEFDECIVKGRSMALNAFYRIARNTMATWFKQPEPSATDVETEYWRHVTGRTHHVCVHSGSIDSSVWGYGFPCTKGSPLARHPWNLKIFTNNSGSILRSMGPVMGVTVPTLHVGMLFTTCCWYRDPHGLPWVEYLHTGASKIWYGIPPSQSGAFRAAMTKLVPRYCKNKTIWLPSDTAMVPPNLLVKNGVSLCRTVQEPGQFILVFPRAFTSSICTGYLVSESVYFSQPGWLSTAEEVFQDIKDSCEPSMFSLERFLIRVTNDPKSNVDVLKQVLPMIFRIRENELERRKQLSALGLKSCERLPQQPVKRSRKGPRSAQDDDGDYECEICRANLYVSLVTDSNEECVYCLQHAIELLTKKKNHVKYCKLLYTYDQAELNEMIQKLLERIETKTQKKSQSKHGALSR